MVLQTVGLDGFSDAVLALCALKVGAHFTEWRVGTDSSVAHMVVRPRESTPETKLFGRIAGLLSGTDIGSSCSFLNFTRSFEALARVL